MRNLNKLFLIVLFFTNSLSATDVFKMAFGSCLHQNYPAPIWTAIKQNNIDSFFFLGDNIYGDTPSGLPWKLKSSYELQKKSIPSWVQSIEQYSIWDDHDYGKNNAGAEYKFKQKAEKLYLDFWNVSSDDERRFRPGIYYASLKSLNNIKVLISGKSNGSKASIPSGGHTPVSGYKLESKKAQKNATKNITSEQMKKIIPYLIPI